MTPAVGRIVIFRETVWQGDGTNGTRDHPAMITRVWSDTSVNLHVFFDACSSAPKSFVTQMPEMLDGEANTSAIGGWRWPDSAA
jgi:hypothetical protein